MVTSDDKGIALKVRQTSLSRRRPAQCAEPINAERGTMELRDLRCFVAIAEEPTVVVIDDDEEIREGLQGLLGSVGLRVELFASVQEFLGSARPDRPGCLVLDVRLPGRSGLDFHDDLARANVHMPVIFISGHADVPMSVRAMKAGAVEFLTKPVRHQDLLDAIQRALDQDRIRREDEKAVADLRASLDTLTLRANAR